MVEFKKASKEKARGLVAWQNGSEETKIFVQHLFVIGRVDFLDSYINILHSMCALVQK